MATTNRKSSPIRNYVAKDYQDFRGELLKYARTFFPNKIQDFGEASVGGLFLDMAAAVGDNLSFYLDHQFRETIWSEAVEVKNIERLIKNSGVKINGASPSTVELTFYIEVPAISYAGRKIPDPNSLPIILKETRVDSNNGVSFTTVSDLDFSDSDKFGNLNAKVVIGDVDSTGEPLTFILSQKVIAVSGRIFTEQFSFNSTYVPFRTISISNANVTDIISVIDSDGNNWYEVDSLTQDTVFIGVVNKDDDNNLVRESLEVIPAPRRFVTNIDLQTRNANLLFGGGDINTSDDDIFPDPSKLSLPMYGKSTIPRFSLDPNSLLRSRTLGISPVSTTLTVTYRAGGGLDHNVGSNTIRSIRTLRILFKSESSSSNTASVKASVDVLNELPATGGAPPPTIDQIRALIPAARNAQQRIVTKSDLISRIYSLPSRFGSVFRAGVRSNPNNPLATQLFVLSRDSNSRLIKSPDTLKNNIRKYINEYRLISDAIDVVDARIINYSVSATIIPDPNANPVDVVRNVISTLQDMLSIRNFQIDQTIKISEVVGKIIGVSGVLSVVKLEFQGLNGTIDGRVYSDVYFDVKSNIFKGLLVGPPGSIFELKYPDFDITITAG